MTREEKKDYIKNQLAQEENKRSYNEIAADLELYLWTLKNKGQAWMDEKTGKKQYSETYDESYNA